MNDIITDEIIKQLDKLPIVKKKAILELIREDESTSKKYDNKLIAQWRKELLTTSVWTDSEINEILKAREYINQTR